MIKLTTKEGTVVAAHEYKLEPKTKFTPGTIKLDGKDVNVKVTGVGHKKFPAYTYATIDGQLYYAKGDYRGAELTLKGAAPTTEEPKKEEEKKPEGAKPLMQPQGKKK